MLDIKHVFNQYNQGQWTTVQKQAPAVDEIIQWRNINKMLQDLDNYIYALRDQNTIHAKLHNGDEVRVLDQTKGYQRIDDTIPQQMAAYYLKGAIQYIHNSDVSDKEARIQSVIQKFKTTIDAIDSSSEDWKKKNDKVNNYVDQLTREMNIGSSELEAMADCAYLLSQELPVFYYNEQKVDDGSIKGYQANLSEKTQVDNSYYLGSLANYSDQNGNLDEHRLSKDLANLKNQPQNELYWLAQRTNFGQDMALPRFLFNNLNQLQSEGVPAPPSANWLPWERNKRLESTLIADQGDDGPEKIRASFEYVQGHISPAGMKEGSSLTLQDKEHQSRLHCARYNMETQLPLGVKNLRPYIDQYGAMYNNGDEISFNIHYQTLISPYDPFKTKEDVLLNKERRKVFHKVKRKFNKGEYDEKLINALGGESYLEVTQDGYFYYPDGNRNQPDARSYKLRLNLVSDNLPYNYARLTELNQTSSDTGKEADEKILAGVANETQKLVNVLREDVWTEKGEFEYSIEQIKEDLGNLADYLNGGAELSEEQEKRLDRFKSDLIDGEAPVSRDTLDGEAQYELAVKLESARQLRAKSYKVNLIKDFVDTASRFVVDQINHKLRISFPLRDIRHEPMHKSILQAACIGTRGAIFTGCKSGRDRTLIRQSARSAYFKHFKHLFNNHLTKEKRGNKKITEDYIKEFNRLHREEIKTGFQNQVNAKGQSIKTHLVDPYYTHSYWEYQKEEPSESLGYKNRVANRYNKALKIKSKKQSSEQQPEAYEHDQEKFEVSERDEIEHSPDTDSPDNDSDETLSATSSQTTSDGGTLSELTEKKEQAKQEEQAKQQEQAKQEEQAKQQEQANVTTASQDSAVRLTTNPGEQYSNQSTATKQSSSQPQNQNAQKTGQQSKNQTGGQSTKQDQTSPYSDAKSKKTEGKADYKPNRSFVYAHCEQLKSTKEGVQKWEYKSRDDNITYWQTKTSDNQSFFDISAIDSDPPYQKWGGNDVPNYTYLRTAAETVENFITSNLQSSGKTPTVYLQEGTKTDPALIEALALYCQANNIDYRNETNCQLDEKKLAASSDNSDLNQKLINIHDAMTPDDAQPAVFLKQSK